MKSRKFFYLVLWFMSLILMGRLTWEYASRKTAPEEKEYSSPSVSSERPRAASVRRENESYDDRRPQVESFLFDPNEADTSQLLRLGLTPVQVRSICRHRARGYSYSSKEDFSRVPFLTKGQWAHLEPLIRIGEQYQLLSPPKTSAGYTDTLVHRSVEASEHGVRENRKDSAVIPRVNINSDSFKRLVAHPFLSFEQVKALKSFQKRYGRISNMSELLALAEFTIEDTVRLSPYVDF